MALVPLPAPGDGWTYSRLGWNPKDGEWGVLYRHSPQATERWYSDLGWVPAERADAAELHRSKPLGSERLHEVSAADAADVVATGHDGPTPFGFYRWDDRLYYGADWDHVYEWTGNEWKPVSRVVWAKFLDDGYEWVQRVPDATAVTETAGVTPPRRAKRG